MNDTLYCGGCGVKIQTENENALGYAPKSALKHEELLCKRCFQMRHYNKNTAVSIEDDEFLKMIGSIRNTDGLIIHLIDLFDVNGTLLSSLPRLVGDNPVLLVANKVDLLPKSSNHHKLKNWLFHLAKEAGIKVVDVFLISAKSGTNFNQLQIEMDKQRKGKDIYVVGVTNVGKSTFINHIVHNATGIKQAITTSYYPGTTLGFIEIPLDDQSALVDTPGVINEEQMAHYVSDADLKLITPTSEVKARNYQLDNGQTLYFGGLARFDFIRGEKQPFVCYFSNRLHIHRTKLENADELYDNHLGKLLSPPDEETLKVLPTLTKSTFKIEEGYTDIVLPGLGWITVIDGDVTVEVHSPKGIAPSIRRSFQ
ncbi:MAG TPA: ribosome biogenesis GTPase YqeH [Pseudogracilibacillus sp.]|nr:ribosome biogenesis GTPase YqeH [Pseudogracilibacillus sp.]